MKIVVTGTRGIPGIQGGIETHCMELYPRIVDQEHEIIVIRRPEYVLSSSPVTEYKGVRIKDIKCLKNKYFEALIHTLKATVYARKVKANILHIHAVGPSLMAPIARLLGLKVVMTHHGEDYDRKKWGRSAKFMLRLGERLGIRYANHVIVISGNIRNMVQRKYPYQRNVSLIYNGVNIPTQLPDKDYLAELNLKEKKYILAVGRLVEEKGFDLLIKTFIDYPDKSVQLVIAGGADHDSDYSRKLHALSENNEQIILTGFINKEKLSQLYTYTGLFVLPSSHEGLPIALLEAMSYGCNVLVSDIAPNKEVQLDNECYFSCGNSESLLKGLVRQYNNGKVNSYDLTLYDWNYIAEQTKQIYNSLNP